MEMTRLLRNASLLLAFLLAVGMGVAGYVGDAGLGDADQRRLHLRGAHGLAALQPAPQLAQHRLRRLGAARGPGDGDAVAPRAEPYPQPLLDPRQVSVVFAVVVMKSLPCSASRLRLFGFTSRLP